jgi:cytochrome oxidase Cu insertion factor (SCO1/SenC/PrrC family)
LQNAPAPFIHLSTRMMKTNLPVLAILAMTATSALANGETRNPELSLGRTAEYDYDAPEPGSYVLPVFKAAADGTVRTSNNKPVRLRELADGRITILSFIYTRCTDARACLRASGVLRQLQQLTLSEPALASNVLLLTLSFDPAYDTPEVMSRYGSVFNEKRSGADWLFLTTDSRDQLMPLLKHYGQQVDRARPGSGTGPYHHLLRVYLIDAQQRIRNIYSDGLLDPRLVMADVRTLQMEAANSKPAPQIP